MKPKQMTDNTLEQHEPNEEVLMDLFIMMFEDMILNLEEEDEADEE